MLATVNSSSNQATGSCARQLFAVLSTHTSVNFIAQHFQVNAVRIDAATITAIVSAVLDLCLTLPKSYCFMQACNMQQLLLCASPS